MAHSEEQPLSLPRSVCEQMDGSFDVFLEKIYVKIQQHVEERVNKYMCEHPGEVIGGPPRLLQIQGLRFPRRVRHLSILVAMNILPLLTRA